ncbi:hypothetical protein MKX01_034593 [Papaver californicum]|nr:hypothetical protein MKX01_034593 [Papaver californicum]
MESQSTLTLSDAGTSSEKCSLNCFGSLAEGNIGSVVVMVTRKREEFDLMITHDITGVDWVIVDVQGYELHAVIPRNLIGKFADQVTEGNLYSVDKLHPTAAKANCCPAYSQDRGLFVCETSVTALEDCHEFIVPNKFRFIEIEMLGPKLDNIYLTG